jgi:hypothetical protein
MMLGKTWSFFHFMTESVIEDMLDEDDVRGIALRGGRRSDQPAQCQGE